jgi:uncharacterized protein YjbI with pentapeptide repeats
LGNAHLEDTNLGQTNLKHVNLTDAYLQGAHRQGANLEFADFSSADLTNTSPEQAKSLQGTILRDVKGLSKHQIQECATRGAIINNEQSP